MSYFRPAVIVSAFVACSLMIGHSALTLALRSGSEKMLGSQSVFTDYRGQRPGTFHKITPADLPRPYATASVDNGPELVSRPAGAWPQVLPGFKVELYASQLDNPRLIRTAPNGDLFVAESKPGRIKVFRGISKDGKAERVEIFASGLKQPFGIAFYPLGDRKSTRLNSSHLVISYAVFCLKKKKY